MKILKIKFLENQMKILIDFPFILYFVIINCI